MYSDLVTLVNTSTISSEMETAYTQSDHDHHTVIVSQAPTNERSAILTNERAALLTNERAGLLYTEVDSTYSESLPSDIRTINSRDLNNFNGESQDNQIKISDVPNTEYGSFDSVRRNVDIRRKRYKKVKRSDSTVSRKSNKFINEAERLMREDEESDLSSSDDSSHDDLDTNEESELFSDQSRDTSADHESVVTTRDYMRVLTGEALVCLTYLRFIALFCQTSLESSVPPIMQKYFDYGDQANSLLYLLAGLELILVFLVLNMASRVISDRILISAGLMFMVTALSWLTATLPTFSESDRSNLPYFAVGVLLDLAGIPTVCDIGLSLYSKLLPDNMQVR